MGGLPLTSSIVKLSDNRVKSFRLLEKNREKPVGREDSVCLESPQLAGEDGCGVTGCLQQSSALGRPKEHGLAHPFASTVAVQTRRKELIEVLSFLVLLLDIVLNHMDKFVPCL